MFHPIMKRCQHDVYNGTEQQTLNGLYCTICTPTLFKYESGADLILKKVKTTGGNFILVIDNGGVKKGVVGDWEARLIREGLSVDQGSLGGFEQRNAVLGYLERKGEVTNESIPEGFETIDELGPVGDGDD
jgi:hypothetical protein